MKKIYASAFFFLCAAAMSINAQTQFVLSPLECDNFELSLYAESISENQNFVAGQDQSCSCPVIWNTVTGDVVRLTDNEMFYDEESQTPYTENYTGTFHSVNSNGLAVGEFGAPSDCSHAIMCDIKNPEDYILLYEEDSDAGNAAYAISEDGSTIVGFHFDANWVTYGCVWTNGGQTRTDLPWPTAEQCGFEIDYASARGMSADGSVIMGYVQDYNYGSWVFICWERQADGTYICNTDACQKYFEYDYQLGKPYMLFEPHNISGNGEWVTLEVEAEFDPWDWNYTPSQRAARLNVKTNELQVLDQEGSVFGIANNGTAVGRVTDASWANQAVIWMADEAELTSLTDLLPEVGELNDAFDTALCNITSDATAATGVCINALDVEPYYAQQSFVASLPGGQDNPVSISQLEKIVKQGVSYDIQGRRTYNTRGHLTIIDGRKVIK